MRSIALQRLGEGSMLDFEFLVLLDVDDAVSGTALGAAMEVDLWHRRPGRVNFIQESA